MWNGKHAGSITDDSVITCDEIAEVKTVPTKNTSIITVPTNCISNKSNSKNFYILLGFLLITITSHSAVIIYCYWIKHRSEQNHLLLYHDTSNKLKEINIKNII